MIILIDGRTLTATSAGISNFLKESVTAWAKISPNDCFIIATPKPVHNTFNREWHSDNVQVKEISNRLFHILPNLIWLSVMMPLLARKYKAGIYYSPLPCLPFLLPKEIKKIIVVHDVVNIEFQHTMQWTNVLVNKLFFNRSIKIADIIWTNSFYTENKIKHYFPQRKCQDIFTGASVNRDIYHAITISSEEKALILKKYHLEQPFIIFVGSLEPRKNLAFLLSLMPELSKRASLQLVIVGGKGWKNNDIRNIIEHPGYPVESVVFCGFVPNEDLVKLYNLARCFVSCSLNEGFGMPQLEALFCECPIVTSHNSAMIEVAGGKDGAVTIEGYDKKKWTDAIIRVSEERPKVNLSQLESYDWNNIVTKLVKNRL